LGYVKEYGETYQYRFIRKLFFGISKKAHSPSFRWLTKRKECSTATNHQTRALLRPTSNNSRRETANTESQTQPTIAKHAIPVGTYHLPVRETK
jgi:hypothetical protein